MTQANTPPIPTASPEIAWGSDVVAELLRRLGPPFIALNPGASYRGLHDSLVNYLGNERPSIVLCLHEEHAVAVAHGYAKVTEQPLAVALHSNVGLMHATMALFNAFCDRVPMLVLGATGPLDAAQRRPWIDWIHTAADQGALIRPYVKWDDQPGSAAAAAESLTRAHQLTCTHPRAPVYVCLDAAVQEAPLAQAPELPDLHRHAPPAAPAPGESDVEAVSDLLAHAERPLILVGRVSRDPEGWDARVRVAEAHGAAVLTDLKTGAGFPTAHPLHPAAPGTFLTPEGVELVRSADAILSLDWIDLGGTLRQAHGTPAAPGRVISCTLDHVLHNGWSKDHFAAPAVDLTIQSHPDLLIAALDRAAPPSALDRPSWPPPPAPGPAPDADEQPMRMSHLAGALNRALADRTTCLVRLPLGWAGRDLIADGPLDYLGQDGGAGLGSGPGMAVGAALALRDSDRLAVAVLGDGDFLMGATAIWTAAHLGLRLLIVVANNRSYFNDEIHQERVARQRARPVENRWVGQRISEPDPDLAGVARSLGLVGHGPVTERGLLGEELTRALDEAQAGAAVLIDVRIEPEGYATGAPAPGRGAS
jgi:thiamine pyrophosphate-dependent acetolactate synthase large subunit-like protein